MGGTSEGKLMSEVMSQIDKLVCIESSPEHTKNIDKRLGKVERSTVYLKSGAELSIQASRAHYSHPKAVLERISSYQAVQLEIKSAGGSLDYSSIMVYAESHPNNFSWEIDIFMWVPLGALIKFIEDNGGLSLTKQG